MNSKKLGKVHEQRAKSYLKKLNYQILEENWRCGKLGELDLIAVDKNRFNQEYLVFIEVKYRSYNLRSALEAVNIKKQIQIQKLSLLYLKSKNIKLEDTNISYDVIAISKDQIEHVKNIFNI